MPDVQVEQSPHGKSRRLSSVKGTQDAPGGPTNKAVALGSLQFSKRGAKARWKRIAKTVQTTRINKTVALGSLQFSNSGAKARWKKIAKTVQTTPDYIEISQKGGRVRRATTMKAVGEAKAEVPNIIDPGRHPLTLSIIRLRSANSLHYPPNSLHYPPSLSCKNNGIVFKAAAKETVAERLRVDLQHDRQATKSSTWRQ
jgi:hypothetical protein